MLEEIGRGGMAVVYRGVDTTLDREVAIKVLHAHLADKEESRRRFEREARAVAKLSHRNILEIYDFSGVDSKNTFIITEFIHGTTLRDFLAEHPVRHPEIAEMVLLEVARAVSHAHASGIIHRDIKPENIMIRDDGVLKLMDFGIAQVIETQQLTVTGSLIGSPAHMSPEAVEGKAQDARSDVFSLGTLLYFLACGKLPFFASNPHALLRLIVDGKYENPQKVQPLVGKRLHGILRRCLNKNPEARFQSVQELIAEIESDLLDIEISDPPREAAAFFRDPERYQSAFETRLKGVLFQSGEAASKRRQVADALDRFNRLLTLDDKDERAQRALEELSRDRGRPWLWAIALVALIAAAGGLWYFVWGSRSPNPRRTPPKVERLALERRVSEGTSARRPRQMRRETDLVPLLGRPVELSAVVHRRFSAEPNLRAGRRPTGPQPTNPDPLPKQPTPPKPTVVAVPLSIRALPISSRILVDRVYRGDGKVDLKLAPKSYVITVVPPIAWLAPTSYRFTVLPRHAGLSPAFVARCRPGRVTITGANVRQYTVRWGASARTSKPGRPVVIPMGLFTRPAQPEVDVSIVVAFRDGRTRTLHAKIAAGQNFARNL
ncbi:MAG: serine/threonine protein kinase [Myxococcales bacterium]|nr:serine/threonine protein kinase [Myxococcales bacterium]